MSSPSHSPERSSSAVEDSQESPQQPQQEEAAVEQHSPLLPPPPVTPYHHYNIPYQTTQQQTPQQQQHWSSYSHTPRAQLALPSLAQATFNHRPLAPPISQQTPQHQPYYHHSPYSPWTGVPSTYGASGGGRPSNDHHVTPSALQLPPPYAYFPQYHSPYGPAQPPLRQPVGFAPPSSAMSSSGGGGVRRGFDAFEQGGYGSVRAEDEMRAAQRRKLAHETELAGGAGETEVDELEEGSQATPPGSISEWNGKVQESLGVEKLGEEQEEKGKGKKKKKSTTTRGVQVDNPYDIPAIADVKPFIVKLRYMLVNPDEFGDLLCWDESGTRIMVKIGDPRLSTDLLPRVFGHAKPASLYRQFSVYNFVVMRPPKGDGVAMPTPSSSAALPATAARDLTQWKVYERTSDKIFSRQTINDVDVLKKLVPKEANSKKTSALAQSQATGGGGGGTKSRRRGGEGTEEG